jgi:hypothetical protein
MLLVNPFTGKLVDASGEVADQLLRAGFKEKEPEVSEPKKPAASTRRSSRSK